MAARTGDNKAGTPLRRIRLCADDYGISPSVDHAIRDLIGRGRLNATSVMVVAPSFSLAEAEALAKLGERWQFAIGLHVTLTAPFQPLTPGFSPRHAGAFPTIQSMMLKALARRLDRPSLDREVTGQIDRFRSSFGRSPDFLDGHQHVHQFPQIRDAVLGAAKRFAPGAWVRQCGSAIPLRQRLGDRKGVIISGFSRSFRRRADALGIATNPAFAGTYDFLPESDFSALFPRFLHRLPDNGLIMCHPGLVDDELKRLDPLTDLREREYAYLGGNDFPRHLAAHGVALA